MAAAGPAPRGCSRAGARAFQYGAAANNTSASTQRKQHWRRTALAPAAPRLAVRAADAHRGPRSAAPPHGKRSPPGEPVGACASRQALSFRPVRCPGPFSLSWWHSCLTRGRGTLLREQLLALRSVLGATTVPQIRRTERENLQVLDQRGFCLPAVKYSQPTIVH